MALYFQVVNDRNLRFTEYAFSMIQSVVVLSSGGNAAVTSKREAYERFEEVGLQVQCSSYVTIFVCSLNSVSKCMLAYILIPYSYDQAYLGFLYF